jgi:hypothetical protein
MLPPTYQSYYKTGKVIINGRNKKKGLGITKPLKR